MCQSPAVHRAPEGHSAGLGVHLPLGISFLICKMGPTILMSKAAVRIHGDGGFTVRKSRGQACLYPNHVSCT